MDVLKQQSVDLKVRVWPSTQADVLHVDQASEFIIVPSVPEISEAQLGLYALFTLAFWTDYITQVWQGSIKFRMQDSLCCSPRNSSS